MACLTEALGMGLKDSAAIPAVHADRLRMAEASGRRAAQMASSGGPRPSDIITPESVENALRVLLAIGGSTNAVLHLTAVAARRGISIDLKRLNRLSDETPVLLDLKPTGQHYLQDLHAAGGLNALMWELRDLLHLDCRTVEGGTLGDRLRAAPAYVDHSVIRRRSEPIDRVGGLVALFGSLAPRGAILKRSAADAVLFEREARAVVFESLEDLSGRIDDPALDVTADDFLVLKNAGPRSASGMPEAGYLPIPKKLARAGVKDMVRISDARMSGTAYGTVVLHVTPDAASGGPLALVCTGDRIRLSVKDKRIDLLVDEAELSRRRAGWRAPPLPARGYARLYAERILQADQGCDFDFLRGVQR
jgi:dihydroxy-acid dehydratase